MNHPPTKNRNVQPSPHERGFTLVELLIVIAIVAVLAAIVFITAQRMISSAKAVKSTGNLRQMSVIINALMTEGVDDGYHRAGGFFPPYAGMMAGTYASFNLWELMGEKAGLCTFENNVFKWKAHPSETFLQDPLSEYKLCDGLKTQDITSKSFTVRGGYSYNAWLEGWTAPHTAENSVKKTRMDDIVRPSRTIMVAVQNRANPTLYNGWAGNVPQGNYRGKAHCLMVDGHAELFDNEYIASHLELFRPSGK